MDSATISFSSLASDHIWFNVDEPVGQECLKGKVVLLYFDSCSSTGCAERVAALKSLGRKFDKQLVCIGIHTPLFRKERAHSHVQKTINRLHIDFPVVNDPDLLLNHHYQIETWPAYTLIAVDGEIKGTLSGDNAFRNLELIINDLGAHANNESVAVNIKLSREVQNDLSFPLSLHAENGLLYVADSGKNRILSINEAGVVRNIFGSESPGFLDGNGTNAAFDSPRGIEREGNFIYVADTGNHAIRRINTQTHDVDTLAGNGISGRAGSQSKAPPLESSLDSPCDLVFNNGNLYITLSGMHQIWKLSLIDQTLDVFTGSGLPGLIDGPPDKACFDHPMGMTLVDETLYVSDAFNSRIRAVDLVTGFAQTLELISLDRTGRHQASSRLQFPQAIISGAEDNTLLVADTYNNRICEIDLNNHTISCITENGIDEAYGLALADSTLYIANTNRHEIITLDLAERTTDTLDVRNEANYL